MYQEIRLKKGLDINLLGEADKVYASTRPAKYYALKPTDFHSLTPKIILKIGDKVNAGTPIFVDKYNDKINFCSPVSGKIIDIFRGEKRKVLEIIIEADEKIIYDKYTFKKNNQDLNREDIIQTMLESGLWPFIRQKPYDIIANPLDNPKSIFISTFKSSPLSIDNDFALYGMEDLFQKGLNYITALTDGKTYLSIDGNTNSSKVFTESKGVEIVKFNGPHPAGNVGVQIHHIDPINKGDVVWYVEPQDVIAIARFFQEGKYDISRIISISGSSVNKPRYYRVISGASVVNLLEENIKSGENRIISGDIFSGKKINQNGYIGFYDTQITVIPEGNYSEFMGWLSPGTNKFSMSRTFLSWIMPNKSYKLDTNMHGEERAYVMTGEYEKVLPMDIYPVHLIKAIMTEDIELMENLGIYEVSPEDFALCEFVCTSKMNVQDIIRQGLDLIRKETS